MQTVIRATLSGSFHKDSQGLQRAYDELVRNQCQVLSPHRLDFIDSSALFVRDRAEKEDSVVSLEKHHLRAIEQSDFLWVHAPDGYVGKSTAMEIGYALALDKPIFTNVMINDQTLAHFVRIAPSVFMAIDLLTRA
jgi:nucleoside 2-deoxyribosyltransferase